MGRGLAVGCPNFGRFAIGCIEADVCEYTDSYCTIFEIYMIYTALNVWNPVWKPRKGLPRSVIQARNNAPNSTFQVFGIFSQVLNLVFGK